MPGLARIALVTLLPVSVAVQHNGSRMKKNTKRILATVAGLIVVAAIWAGWQWQQGSALPSQVQVGSEQPFAWVDCKARLFDGAPAVAVMFSQPLARSQD